jgi:alanyl-tRNA synthetase
MNLRPAYERDPYLRELATTIVETGEDRGHPFAVLDDTVFYPEGGGQPSDRGTINGVAVLDVVHSGDSIRHMCAAPLTAGAAHAVLDWRRRFDHMQQHSAQHLLTALCLDRFGLRTTAFHLGETRSDIELDVPSLPSERLVAIDETVAEAVRAAVPITVRWVTAAEMATLPVRSRGLPGGHTGDVRLVEIAGLDLNTCGGTHLRSTAEIECVLLCGTEPMRGGTRVFFVAGRRARQRFVGHEARNAELRRIVGTGDDELAEVIELKLGQLQAAERHARGLEEELSSAVAAGLASQQGSFVEAHYDDRDAGFLQRVARQLADARPDLTAVLTASSGEHAFFALVFAEAAATRASALGKQLAETLSGRGGGSGRCFQGKAGSLANRASAIAALRCAI